MIDQLHIKYDPNKYINQVLNFLTKTSGLAKGKNIVIRVYHQPQGKIYY